MVAIVSVTVWGVLPGVTVADGVNKEAVPGGNCVVTANTTGFPNVPFVGAIVK